MASGYAATKAWRERHPNIKAYRAEEARKWRLAHPDKHRAILAKHRSKNMETIRERSRIYQAKKRKQDPEGQRRRQQQWRARKITAQESIAGRSRPSVCELCSELNLRIVFDHCHSTNKFRGWLCDRCNKTLGMVKDSPDLLEKLAQYLRGHNG